MRDGTVAHRDRGLLIIGGVAVFFTMLFVVGRPWDLENGFMIGAHVGRDFANFWLAGRLAIEGRLDLLVDLPAYNDLFSHTFNHTPEESFVYSYPPLNLLLVVPFSALPFVPAVYLWSAANLICIERSTRLLSKDWKLAAAACLSPAVLTMLAFGHFGGLLALLATFALTRAHRQPIFAGLCLALMSVKPQFALTWGLLLTFAGQWRAVLWSVPPALGLVALSMLAFGIKPWVNFFEWTVPFHAQLISSYLPEGLRNMISVYAGARMAGLPGWLAQLVQYAFSLVVMVKAALLLRRHDPHDVDAGAMALCLLAALAALPYFNSYDLAIVAPALAVALLEQRPADRAPFMLPVPAALLWLAPALALPLAVLALPIVPAIVAAVLLLGLFGRRGNAIRPVESIPHATGQ
jgi:alpha-1,2-mannosyltransferase